MADHFTNGPLVGMRLSPVDNSYYGSGGHLGPLGMPSGAMIGNFQSPVVYEYLIPDLVTQVGVYVQGAGGGSGQSDGGGRYRVDVTPGDIIKFEVGGAGKRIASGGGWPDGGHGGLNTVTGYYGLGGGGSTRVYLNGTLIIVQGGRGGDVGTIDPAFPPPDYDVSGLNATGGRGGYDGSPSPYTGQLNREGEDGRRAPSTSPATTLPTGKGGEQAAGGAAGSGGSTPATAGSSMQGGNGASFATSNISGFLWTGGGGGGGGYYGGGGGGIDPAASSAFAPSGAVGTGGGGSTWYDTSVVTLEWSGAVSNTPTGGPPNSFQGAAYIWHATTIKQKFERWGGIINPVDEPESVVLHGTTANFGLPWAPRADFSRDTTWTSASGAGALTYLAVAWSPVLGMFAAVGNNRVATSPDGITWTARTPPSSGFWTSICWAGGSIQKFVATSLSDPTTTPGIPRIMTSDDGITWTQRTCPNPPRLCQEVRYSADLDQVLIVGTAGSGAGNTSVIRSTDGITWTAGTSTTTDLTGLGWGQGKWVAVRNSNSGATSPDGITWTAMTIGATTADDSVAYSPELGMWVAAGSSGSQVRSSPDGTTWTGRTITSPASGWRRVLWVPEHMQFVAIGQPGFNALAVSSDGINWTTHTGPGAGDWRDIDYSPARNRFVAVRNDAAIRYW